MFILLVILSCIAGVLLIGAVLIQPGKGDLAAGFGGVGGQFGSMIGMRRAADFIQKTTIGLAVAIMLMALASNTIFSPRHEEAAGSQFEGVNTSPSPSAQPAQPAPAGGQPAPAGGNAQPAPSTPNTNAPQGK